LNSISQEFWRDELYREEKATQKHQQYLQIVQTFITVSSEWLRRMVLEIPSNLQEEIRTTIDFFRYINTQIKLVNNRFKCNLGMLPDNLLRL
jgi:hypothetical protein